MFEAGEQDRRNMWEGRRAGWKTRHRASPSIPRPDYAPVRYPDLVRSYAKWRPLIPSIANP